MFDGIVIDTTPLHTALMTNGTGDDEFTITRVEAGMVSLTSRSDHLDDPVDVQPSSPRDTDDEHGREDNEYSCFVLSRTNPLRRYARTIVYSQKFETAVMVLVLLSAACLGLADYSKVQTDPDRKNYGLIRKAGWRNEVVFVSDHVFGNVFVVECLLKIVAMGFRGSQGSYARDPWNCFDFFLVISWTLEVVIANWIPLRRYGLSLRGIRMVRLLRPLRTISRFPKWRRVATGIVHAAPNLASVLGLLFALFYLYCLLGVQMFAGAQHGRCRLTPYPVLLNYSFDLHSTNYSAFRCKSRRDTFRNLLRRRNLKKDKSPWKTPVDCYWPIDNTDPRLCSLYNFGMHACAHHTERLELAEYRWCGSDFDPFGHPRFKRTELFSDYELNNLKNPYYYPGHSRAWNVGGTRVDPGVWSPDHHFGATNYDNVVRAMISNFIFITLGDWSRTLSMMQDASGEHISAVYAYIIILFGGLAGINIFVAVLEESYTHAYEHDCEVEKTDSDRQHATVVHDGPIRALDYSRRLRQSTSDGQELPHGWYDCLRWKLPPSHSLSRCFESGLLETVTAAVLLIDAAALAFFRREMSETAFNLAVYVLYICHVYFVLEMFIKMSVLSIKRYWATIQHVFDGVICIWLSVELFMLYFLISTRATRSANRRRTSILFTIRLFRFFRVVDKKTWRIAQKNACLRAFGVARFLWIISNALRLIGNTLRDVINILVILAIFAYCFALFGMQLFANRLRVGPSDSHVNLESEWFDRSPLEDANFDTLGNAIVTVYQLLIGDKFTHLLAAFWRGRGPISLVYVFVIIIVGRLILLNLFLSILLSNAARFGSDFGETGKFPGSSQSDLDTQAGEDSLLSAVRGRLDSDNNADSRSASSRLVDAEFREDVKAESAYDTVGEVRNLAADPTVLVHQESGVGRRNQNRQFAGSASLELATGPSSADQVESGLASGIPFVAADKSIALDEPKQEAKQVLDRAAVDSSLLNDSGIVRALEYEPQCTSRNCWTCFNCPGTNASLIPAPSARSAHQDAVDTLRRDAAEIRGEVMRDALLQRANNDPQSLFQSSSSTSRPMGAVSYTESKDDVMYMRGRARKSLELFSRCVRKYAEAKGQRDGTPPNYKYVFKIFDSDNSGDITIEELKRGSIALDVGLNDRQITAMIEVVDEDGDGVVSYSEFLYHFGPRAANFHDRIVEGEIELLQNMRTQSMYFAPCDMQARIPVGSPWACITIFPLEPGKSLGLFSPINSFRLACARLADWQYCEPIVLVLVIVSCVILLVDTPLANPRSRLRRGAINIDATISLIFAAEIAAKVIASGLYTLGPRAYLRSAFNIIDMFAVGCGLTSDAALIISRMERTNDNLKVQRFLNAARALRATRALRIFRHFAGLRKLVEAFCEALPNILQVGAVVVFLLYVFALLFRTLLAGHLRTCKGRGETPEYVSFALAEASIPLFRRILRNPTSWEQMSNATKDLFGPSSQIYGYSNLWCNSDLGNQSIFVSKGRPYPCCKIPYKDTFDASRTMSAKNLCTCAGYSWGKDQPYRFDNVGLALKALVAVATGSIADVMYATTSIDSRSSVLIPETRPTWYPIWIAFQVIASLVFFNLFVASTVEAFITIRKRHQLQADESLFVTVEQRTWADYVKRVLHVQPEVRLKHELREKHKTLWWITTKRFEYFATFVVCLDIVFLSIGYFGQSHALTMVLEIETGISYALFTLEAVLKIAVIGAMIYFSRYENQADFTVTIFGDAVYLARRTVFANGVFKFHPILSLLESLPRLLRVFRLASLAKRARAYASPRRILDATGYLGPALINMLFLVVVFFFMFAIIGVQLFGRVAFNGANNAHMNFRTVGRGFMTLLMFATNENWDRWMSSAAHRINRCTPYPKWDSNMCGFRDRPGCDVATVTSSKMCLKNNPESKCLIPMDGCGSKWSYLYVLSFMIFINFVLVNLFIGVVLESFKTSQAKLKAGDASFFSHEVTRNFTKLWSLYDARGTGLISRSNLRKLLTQLGRPLGFGYSPDELDRFESFWEREYAPARREDLALIKSFNNTNGGIASAPSAAPLNENGAEKKHGDTVEKRETGRNVGGDHGDAQAVVTYDPCRVALFSEIGHFILDSNDALLAFERLKDKVLFEISAPKQTPWESLKQFSSSSSLSSVSETGSSRSITQRSSPATLQTRIGDTVRRVRRRLVSKPHETRHDFVWRETEKVFQTRWLSRIGSMANREASQRKLRQTYDIHDVLLSLVTEMRLNDITGGEHAALNNQKILENKVFMSTVIAICQLDAVPFDSRHLVLANINHCTPNAIAHRIVRHSVAIRSLDVRNTQLGESGCDVLCDALEHVGIAHLRALQVANCNIRSSGVRSLSQLLYGAPSLVHFDVSSNLLDSRAIAPLAQLVESLVHRGRLLRRFALFVADNPQLTRNPLMDHAGRETSSVYTPETRHGESMAVARNLATLIRSFDIHSVASTTGATFRNHPIMMSLSSVLSDASLDRSTAGFGSRLHRLDSRSRYGLSLRGCKLGSFFSEHSDSVVALHDEQLLASLGYLGTGKEGAALPVGVQPINTLTLMGAAPLVCLDLCANELDDTHIETLVRAVSIRPHAMLNLDLRHNPQITKRAQRKLIDATRLVPPCSNRNWVIFADEDRKPRRTMRMIRNTRSSSRSISTSSRSTRESLGAASLAHHP